MRRMVSNIRRICIFIVFFRINLITQMMYAGFSAHRHRERV